MKLNKYTTIFSTLFLLLLSNNVFSMEYNAAPHPINNNEQNRRNIDEIIQQNIKIQEQLTLLNKQVKDMQEQYKKEKEDKKREENFKKVLRNNTCEAQDYKCFHMKIHTVIVYTQENVTHVRDQ